MSCKDCEAASKDITWSAYNASCGSCLARQIAHSDEAKRSREAGRNTPEYQKAMVSAFGEGWFDPGGGHDAVRDWGDKIAEAEADKR